MVAELGDFFVSDLLAQEGCSPPDDGSEVVLHLLELDEEDVWVVATVPETLCAERKLGSVAWY